LTIHYSRSTFAHRFCIIQTAASKINMNESHGYILAIDQGTTGTKVLIFDCDCQIRAHVYAEFTQRYPQPGWVEHDAAEIWRSTHQLIGEAIAKAHINASDVRAVGITNQRETVVAWHKKTSEPVARAVVWQDRRTAQFCDELKMRGLETMLRRKTGLVIDPYFSATKIKWLLDNIPNLRERAARGEIAFGTIDSWLVWKLTGGAAHVTDHSNAARTLLFNIHELKWDAELLALFDVPQQTLPLVKPSSQVYGHTAAEEFFGARVPVAGIAGDQQAALFGQACFDTGMAKNTYGTGSFVLLNTGRQAVESQHGLLTTIAWALNETEIEYALEGSVFITGAAIQWLRDGLQIIETVAESEALASSLASNDGVYFVPALAGLGAPHWDAYARGAIVGLTRGTTRAHIARATLESICYQTRDVIEAMERDAGVPLKTLRVDGGAVKNLFLMQFQADILGVPVEVPTVTETTAFGAACLAGLAVGFWQSRAELAARWKVKLRFEPQLSEAERERLHHRWRRAVEHARDWARD
jgi:glycerol kinase